MGKKFLGTLALGALIGSALGLFLSPGKGKENRAKFTKITKKVSEKLIEDVMKLNAISKKEYEAVVENIIDKYSKDDLMDPASWLEIKNELKLRWKDVQAEMKKHGKKAKTKVVAKKKK
jgi:gas vesicle protein